MGGVPGERPALVPIRGPFHGFREVDVGSSKTCLVRFDRNRYSIEAKAANRPVQLRAYADRVVVRFDGEVVATISASWAATVFATTGCTICRSWPATRRPAQWGPVEDWELPSNPTKLRARLAVPTSVASSSASSPPSPRTVSMPSRTPAAWPRPKACAAAMRRSTSSHGAATARRRRPWRRRPSAVARRPNGRSRPLRPLRVLTRRLIVERHDLLALMTKLRLAGMRAAYDDITRNG